MGTAERLTAGLGMSEPEPSSGTYLDGSGGHQRGASKEQTSIPEAARPSQADGAQRHEKPHNIPVDDEEDDSAEWMPARQGAPALSGRFELVTPAPLDQRFSYGLSSFDDELHESQRDGDNTGRDDNNIDRSGDRRYAELDHGEVTNPSAGHGDVQTSRYDGSDDRDDENEGTVNGDTIRPSTPTLSPSSPITHLDQPYVESPGTGGQTHSTVERNQSRNIRSTATQTHESATAIQKQEEAIPSRPVFDPLQQIPHTSPGPSTVRDPQIPPPLPPPLHGRPWGVPPLFVPPPVPPPTWGMLAPPRRRRRDIFHNFVIHPINTLRGKYHGCDRPTSTPSLSTPTAPRHPTPPPRIPSPQSRPPSPLLPPTISAQQAAREHQQFVLAGGWTPWSQRAQITRESHISQPTNPANYYFLAEAEHLAASGAPWVPRPMLPQPSVQRAPTPTQLERQQQQNHARPTQPPHSTRSASLPHRIQGPRPPPPSPAWTPPFRIPRPSAAAVNSAWLLPPARPSRPLPQRQQGQAQTRNNSVRILRRQISLSVLHEIEDESEGGEDLGGRPYRARMLREPREDVAMSGMEKLKGFFSRRKDRGI